MYAKTLIPGPPLAVPTIVATTSQADLERVLLARGWGRFGEEFPQPPDTEVRIRPNGLTIETEDLVLLDDDTNPVSPPGWWAAVDGLGGRCVVVITPDGADIDLTSPDVGDKLAALREAGQGWCAVLPVHSR